MTGAEQGRTQAKEMQPNPGMLHLLTFRVGDEEYGMDAGRVREIVDGQPLTHVPNFPAYVEGVTELRERVIPVVGLRKRFGLGSLEPGKSARIIVTDMDGDVIGFEVDSVAGVVQVPISSVEPLPRLRVPDNAYVSGVSRTQSRLVLVVDVNRLAAETDVGTTVTSFAPASMEAEEGLLVS